jgi:hypothetical protein
MASRKSQRTRDAASVRIRRIQEQILEMDYVSSGSLVTRTKVCGKPSCRCATDREARHGPYHEWGYMKGGRQVHRVISADQAPLLKKAFANYRAVMRLLREWERQTIRVLDTQTSPKPDKRKS